MTPLQDTAAPVSRQRLWQRERQALGYCPICGHNPPATGRIRCSSCTTRSNAARAKGCWHVKPPEWWRALDWTQTNAQLSRQTGKHKLWIAKQRARYGQRETGCQPVLSRSPNPNL